MRKIILFGLFYLLTFSPAFCQQLYVGDKVPEFQLHNIFNYSRSNLKFSDFKGKHLILELWETTCSACIDGFPRLDSLQQRFKDKLQIILVNTAGDKDSIANFFKKRKKVFQPRIPFVTADTIIKRYIPKNFSPWVAWIDKDRRLRYVTQGYSVTTENISRFLQGEPLQVTQLVYSDNYQAMNSVENPVLDNEKLVFHSYLLRCGFGHRQGTKVSLDETGPASVSYSCESILELCKIAFSERGKYLFLHPRTVQLNVQDPFRYHYPAEKSRMDEWTAQQNTYSYYLKVPADRKDEIFQIMQKDIESYFRLKVKVQKQKKTCFYLINTGDLSKLTSDTLLNECNFSVRTGELINRADTVYQVKGFPFQKFVRCLSLWSENKNLPQIVDSTGFTGNINIKLHSTLISDFTLTDLKKELSQYNLTLVEGDVFVDVLTIKEFDKK